MPKALKCCPKSNKSPNLVTLMAGLLFTSFDSTASLHINNIFSFLVKSSLFKLETSRTVILPSPTGECSLERLSDQLNEHPKQRTNEPTEEWFGKIWFRRSLGNRLKVIRKPILSFFRFSSTPQKDQFCKPVLVVKGSLRLQQFCYNQRLATCIAVKIEKFPINCNALR